MSAARSTAILVGGALFSPEGKLLLLRRAATVARPNEWELPCAPIDFGEAPELAAIRAFADRTGLDVSVDRPLGAWSELERSDAGERHVVHIDFTVRLTVSLLAVETDPDLDASFAWVNVAEAGAKIESPAARASAERAFAMLARSRSEKPKQKG